MLRSATILLFILSLSDIGLTQTQFRNVSVRVTPAGGIHNFNYYNSDAGFFGTTVESVIQDSRGNVWAGSRSGVYKLDGLGVTEFNMRNGLQSDYIQCLAEGEDNVIWVGTREGLASIDGNVIRQHVFTDTALSRTAIWSLVRRKDGKMLLGTSKGIYMVEDGAAEFYMNIDTTTMESNLPRVMAYDSKGVLWVGCWNNMNRVDDKKKVVLESFTTDVTLGWAEAPDGTVYFSSWGPGLCSYKDGILTTYQIGFPVPGVQVDPWGTVWLGTWEHGLVRMQNDTTAVEYSISEGLPVNIVWGLLCDQEGRIWCGTFGGGLCQLADFKFNSFSRLNGLEANITQRLDIDTAGNLWVGSEGGLAMIMPNGKVKAFSSEDGFEHNAVMGIDATPDGHVHVVTYIGGIGYYEWDGTKLICHQRGGAMDIFFDSRGNRWEGLESDGVVRYQPDGTRTIFKEISNKKKKRVFEIQEDNRGRIWLGAGEHAWHVIDSGNFFYELFPERLRTMDGAGFAQDYMGNYWLGISGHGIYRCTYYNGHLEIMDSLCGGRGLVSDGAACMLIRGKVMWLNTDEGLVKFDLGEYYRNGEIKTKIYDRYHGFAGQGTSNIVELSGGDLAIATSKGVLRFHEEFDKPLAAPPFTNIRSVELNKMETDWTPYAESFKPGLSVPEKINLDYDQNHLTFNFIGISFSYPDAVRYQYKLEGFDNDWSPATKITQAVYSNIQPGDYTFMVRAMNRDAMWDETPDTVVIHIEAPFWQKTWFRIVAFLTTGVLIYLLVMWRLNKLRKAKKILEFKVKERTVQLELAYHQIEEKNVEITDSINYAKRIQSAILPSAEKLKKLLGDSFVLYKPKDIVAGDFYWLHETSDKCLIAVADCTGHGVPGAMVSIICYSALNRSVREFGLTEPAAILDKTREIIIQAFESSDEDVKDGMDVSLCSWDRKNNRFEFAGAQNGIYRIRKGDLQEIEADKQPVGKFSHARPFTNQVIDLQAGDQVYLSSDGFADQFGGDKGKKLKNKSFRQLLIDHSQLTMNAQLAKLDAEFEQWRGDFEQVDDVCVIGIRV